MKGCLKRGEKINGESIEGVFSQWTVDLVIIVRVMKQMFV